MRSEQAKGAEKIKVFLCFVQAVDFPIAATSIEKRDQPEPDLRCIHAMDGPITFEFVELCDPNLAKAISIYRKCTSALQILQVELFRRNFVAIIRRIFLSSSSAIQTGASLLQIMSSFPLWASTCNRGNILLGEHGFWVGVERTSSDSSNLTFERIVELDGQSGVRLQLIVGVALLSVRFSVVAQYGW